MAANPVSAFMAGFAVVDQLETNRQAREFRAQDQKFKQESQSQLRKDWEFRNEEMGRIRMENRRKDNFAQFEGASRSLMDEIAGQGESIAQAHIAGGTMLTLDKNWVDEQGNEHSKGERLDNALSAEFVKSQYLNQWFSNSTMVNGRPAGFLRFSNEVIKRLIARNPEFGEHMALATGFDAAAGPLVKDTGRPVTGATIVAAEQDPKGIGGLVVEVAGEEGGEVGTVNRTNQDTDPVFMGRLGLEQMTEIFGAEILDSKSALAIQMMNALGIKPTGQMSSQDRKVQDAAAATTTGPSESAATESPAVLQHLKEGVVTEEDLAAGDPFPDGTANIKGEEPLLNAEQSARLAANQGGGKEATDAGPFPALTTDAVQKEKDNLFSDASFASKGASWVRLMANDATNLFNETLTIEGADEAGLQRAGELLDERYGGNKIEDNIVQFIDEVRTGEPSTATFQDKAQGVWNSIGDFFSGEKEVPKQLTDKAVTSVKDIVGNGAKASDFTADKVSKPGNSAAKAAASVAAPVTQQAVTQMVSSMSPVRGARPSVPQIYNALALAKGGIFTAEQVYRYANTGSFDKPAGRAIQLFDQGDRGIFAVDKNTLGSARIPGSADPNAGDAESDIDIFKDQRTLLENRFRDRDGKIQHGLVQRTLEQVETATDVLQSLGIITRDQRTDRSMLTSLATGQQYVDRFSADPSQTFDFNPFSDPELGPNNMVLGFIADRMGVTSQSEADRFLFDYGITLRNAFPRMSAEDLIRNVIAIEREARGNDSRTKLVANSIEKEKKGGS